MKPRFLLLILMVVVAVFCISNNISAENGLEGMWHFRVDRVWDGSGDPSFPFSPLAESSYCPVANGPTYRIEISGSPGKDYLISIGDPPIKGHQMPANSLEHQANPLGIVFSLDVFVGGRFVIMPGKNVLQGELTKYGSGRPIIKSERGVLTR